MTYLTYLLYLLALRKDMSLRYRGKCWKFKILAPGSSNWLSTSTYSVEFPKKERVIGIFIESTKLRLYTKLVKLLEELMVNINVIGRLLLVLNRCQ